MFSRILLCFCCLLLIQPRSAGQLSAAEISLLQQLDSLANSANPGAGFAVLYRETTLEAILQSARADEKEKLFIEQFEIAFASLFFKAANATDSNRSPVWQPVYTTQQLSPEKRLLLAINAHVNGDLWQALAFRFSGTELRRNKKVFFRYQQALSRVFDRFYPQLKNRLPFLQKAHLLTAGRIRQLGQTLFFSWRRTQYRLALRYHEAPASYQKTLTRVNRKKEGLDHFILRHL